MLREKILYSRKSLHPYNQCTISGLIQKTQDKVMYLSLEHTLQHELEPHPSTTFEFASPLSKEEVPFWTEKGCSSFFIPGSAFCVC
jgi:hypothetical protein